MSAALELAAPALGIEPAFYSCTPRTGRTALGWGWLQPFPQPIRQTRHRPLTVLPLRSFLSDHNPEAAILQMRRQLLLQPRLAKRTQHLELSTSNRSSTLESVVFAPCPWAGCAGEAPVQLVSWNHQAFVDSQLLNQNNAPPCLATSSTPPESLGQSEATAQGWQIRRALSWNLETLGAKS